MANQGQPTIRRGDTGAAVRWLQRAIRRMPFVGFVVDGIFGAETERVVKDVQHGAGVTVDGVVGSQTWPLFPDGAPMPVLRAGAHGPVVHSLQQVLHNGASTWGTGPGTIDGQFGAHTEASVKAFQGWAGLTQDGVVGDHTWGASLHAASATLESE